MKKQTTNFNPLNSKQLEGLAAQVKETLALGKARVFSAAELWDIQRRSRTMTSRRSYAY